MRRLFGIALWAFILALAVATVFQRTEKATGAARPPEKAAPVVVELFTSEGCSSCPPADALLLRLMQRPDEEPIVALEEHVDYWDELGWKDPFSSHDWTARQESYAASFGNGSVYTPQMVVDGQAEFVGSREGQARRAIGEAAGKKKTEVRVTPARDAKDKQGFEVNVGKLTGASGGDTAEVWLAITETGLHSAVTRGENAGEDLYHAAVVRTLRRIGVADAKDPQKAFTGEASVNIDPGWKRDNLRAVVFVQEKRSRQIVGAAETKFTP